MCDCGVGINYLPRYIIVCASTHNISFVVLILKVHNGTI